VGHEDGFTAIGKREICTIRPFDRMRPSGRKKDDETKRLAGKKRQCNVNIKPSEFLFRRADGENTASSDQGDVGPCGKRRMTIAQSSGEQFDPLWGGGTGTWRIRKKTLRCFGKKKT